MYRHKCKLTHYIHLNILKKSTLYYLQSALEAPPGFEPGNKGFADLDLTAWL